MRIEYSGIDPATTGRRPDAQGAPSAEEDKRAQATETQTREDSRQAASSTRVTLSAEARTRLAAEESGARAESRKAVEEKGAVAKLLETQKERTSQADGKNEIRPPSTQPQQNDQASIRGAEQRLASAGLLA